MFNFFATWSESFLKFRQNFFDKNVKTAFYVSRQTYCRKKFIHQFQNMREIFSDFGQETRHTRFFPKLHSACGERVWQKFPWNFFQFSAGSPNWTLALRRNFSSKKTFHEKNIHFYRFRTLTELHLRVQRKVLFRNTVLDLFLSGHDFKPKVFKFGGISLNFSFETAFYVTTRKFITFARMFFSGKSTYLFIILKFWAETFD